MVLRLLHYWREIGTDDAFPAAGDVEPEAIPDMWPDCLILAVAGKESDPEFLYVGDRLTEAGDQELVGTPVSAAPPDTLAGRAVSYFGQVLAKRVPITRGGEFTDSTGAKVLYRSIILPLAEDGKVIDRLLAAANCRRVVET